MAHLVLDVGVHKGDDMGFDLSRRLGVAIFGTPPRVRRRDLVLAGSAAEDGAL